MAKTKKADSEEDKKVAEATEIKDDKKSKLEALKERAKKLAESTDEGKKELKKELKKEIKAEKGEVEEKSDALVPIEDYLKASVHLGTRVITPDMRKYVYRRRADG